MSHSARIVAALADPERLDLFARIVGAEKRGVAVAELERSVPGAARQLGRLVQAGIVARRADGSYACCPEAFRQALAERPEWSGADPVGRLFSGGRLVAVPSKRAPRRALLDRLAEDLFEPGRCYTEREVNAALTSCHDDFPALRRYLVDEGLLVRSADGAEYRRAERTTA